MQERFVRPPAYWKKQIYEKRSQLELCDKKGGPDTMDIPAEIAAKIRNNNGTKRGCGVSIKKVLEIIDFHDTLPLDCNRGKLCILAFPETLGVRKHFSIGRWRCNFPLCS